MVSGCAKMGNPARYPDFSSRVHRTWFEKHLIKIEIEQDVEVFPPERLFQDHYRFFSLIWTDLALLLQDGYH